MKYLYILRHSKAGQTNKKIVEDHERTLTDKGARLCQPLGEYLASLRPYPQHALCSTAVRARQTLELATAFTAKPIETTFRNRLYLADTAMIYQLIHEVDDSIDSLLVVGHNPGLHLFAMDVAGKGDKKMFRDLKNHFPPPSIASFEIEVESWGLVATQSAALADFRNPKTL